MSEALAHRGRDGEARWKDGSVGLVQRLLWTTPESVHETFPLADDSGAVRLVADARIDNRDELVASLELGCRSGPLSDGRLILHAYKRWGPRFPEKLIGDFSIAIWDARDRVLVCARDPMGVKPFYYFARGGAFAFGSELKALFALEEVPRRLDPEAIAAFLAGVFDDSTTTLYQHLHRLAPGHVATISVDGQCVSPFWKLDPTRTLRLGSDEEYAEAFRERFLQAVDCRLRSAFPVGSTLSGGLDSSSIACAARELLGSSGRPRLHTFSAVFPGLPERELGVIDERRFVQAALDGGGFRAHLVPADRISPLEDLDRVLWHQDEAIPAANLYMHWAMFREARAHGVRVFLDGLDGDTTVSHGLQRLGQLARRGRLLKLVSESAALSRRWEVRSWSTWRIVRELGLKPAIPAAVRRAGRALFAREAALPSPIPIRSEIVRAARLRERLAERERTGAARTAHEEHWLGLTSPLMPYALEMADKAAAAFGLESRFPFFDQRLVEFCLALPEHQKLSGGWTRAILRRSMKGILPESIRSRVDKASLSPNLRIGMWRTERATLDELILSQAESVPRFAEFVDVPALQIWYRGWRDQPTADGAFHLYRVVTFARWLTREHTGGGPGPRTVPGPRAEAGPTGEKPGARLRKSPMGHPHVDTVRME